MGFVPRTKTDSLSTYSSLINSTKMLTLTIFMEMEHAIRAAFLCAFPVILPPPFRKADALKKRSGSSIKNLVLVFFVLLRKYDLWQAICYCFTIRKTPISILDLYAPNSTLDYK